MDRKVPPSPLPKIWAAIKQYVAMGYHAVNDFKKRVTSSIGDVYRGTWFYSWWISLCEKYWIVHIIDRGIYWGGLTILGLLGWFWTATLGIAVLATLFLMFVRIVSAMFLAGRITPPPFHIIEAYGEIWAGAFEVAFGFPLRFLKWLFFR